MNDPLNKLQKELKALRQAEEKKEIISHKNETLLQELLAFSKGTVMKIENYYNEYKEFHSTIYLSLKRPHKNNTTIQQVCGTAKENLRNDFDNSKDEFFV